MHRAARDVAVALHVLKQAGYRPDVEPYGQFCPVSRALEALGERWTLLVVRELLAGSSRFGELQRGLPGCPPATLSKRLRQLTALGVVERTPTGYRATEAGWELFPLLEGLGRWGQRWVRSDYGPGELTPELLLWDVHRFLQADALGVQEAVVELRLEPGRRAWVVLQRGGVDVCLVDPQRPVDALLETPLRTLARLWMGDDDWAAALARGDVRLSGPPDLVARLPGWIGRHPLLADVARAR